MRFPKGRVVLSNAKLEFVNLDNVLADSKKERASKISGYLEILYPEGSEILFLKKGEPVNAARFTREERKILTIIEVIEKAKKSVTGTVNIYETGDELIEMMLATLTLKHLFKDLNVQATDPEKVLSKLAQVKFSGFLELRKGVEVSYVRFKEGNPVTFYPSGKGAEPTEVEGLVKLLISTQIGETPTLVDGYEKLAEIPEQATPAQITLFVNTLNKIVGEVKNIAGPTLVQKTLLTSKETIAVKYPCVKDLSIDSDSRLSGNILVTPDELSRIFAEWIDLFVDSFRVVLGKRLDTLVQNSFKDYRFALKSTNFGQYSKLKNLL
ncbi:MAG: hypothetical protein AB1393_05310 [Candidatus Edwardsbacteria bacterium]